MPEKRQICFDELTKEQRNRILSCCYFYYSGVCGMEDYIPMSCSDASGDCAIYKTIRDLFHCGFEVNNYPGEPAELPDPIEINQK